jgi:hypothetical protein
MSNTDTDFIILDENPVYANQISEFVCLRFQRPQLYIPVQHLHKRQRRYSPRASTIKATKLNIRTMKIAILIIILT